MPAEVIASPESARANAFLQPLGIVGHSSHVLFFASPRIAQPENALGTLRRIRCPPDLHAGLRHLSPRRAMAGGYARIHQAVGYLENSVDDCGYRNSQRSHGHRYALPRQRTVGLGSSNQRRRRLGSFSKYRRNRHSRPERPLCNRRSLRSLRSGLGRCDRGSISSRKCFARRVGFSNGRQGSGLVAGLSARGNDCGFFPQAYRLSALSSDVSAGCRPTRWSRARCDRPSGPARPPWFLLPASS